MGLFPVQAKESWEMNTDEKLEQGSIAKEKGTHYFKVSLIYSFIVLLLKVSGPLTP